MKKSILLSIAAILLFSVSVTAQNESKLVSTKTQIQFFSTTPAEDIDAHNTAAVSTINKSTGEVVFSVPMQGFEFDKRLMQRHFNNEEFLDTKKHPDAKLKGKITNLSAVDFSTDGEYNAKVNGDLTIKGVTNKINESGKITVKGDVVKVHSIFDVTLADYGIKFSEGKPATNIAETVQVTVQAEYK